jgi:hypothetical protein
MRTMLAPLFFSLASCMGMPLGGANPLSASIALANVGAAQSLGKAQAAVITPQEQAKFASLSCSDLADLIGRYETGLSMNEAAKAQSKKGAAIADTAITARIRYLENLASSRGCA